MVQINFSQDRLRKINRLSIHYPRRLCMNVVQDPDCVHASSANVFDNRTDVYIVWADYQ